MGKAAYLFTRNSQKKQEEWRNKYGGTQASRLAEDEAKAKKAADKARDKERKKAKKEAAAKALADVQKNSEVKTEKKEEKKSIEATGEKVELPLRGAVAEEEAPPLLLRLERRMMTDVDALVAFLDISLRPVSKVTRHEAVVQRMRLIMSGSASIKKKEGL